VRQLARLFGLGRSEVADALGALVRAGAARTDVAVPGLPVDLVVHRALLERLGAGS
jgi:hypothetical protein